MTASTRLAALSLLVAIGATAAYVSLLRVAVVRNHPEGYVVAFALAVALAAVALIRSRNRRWPAWLALGLSSLLLVFGASFNFVLARVPEGPTTLRVGDRPPDFTLPDAAGRPVALADYRGRKPVVLVFYRGYW
jgi:AhpC/TSA family protein